MFQGLLERVREAAGSSSPSGPQPLAPHGAEFLSHWVSQPAAHAPGLQVPSGSALGFSGPEGAQPPGENEAASHPDVYIIFPLSRHSVGLLHSFHQPSEEVKGFPCSSVSKDSACSAGDPGSIPGWRRSPGEGNGNPLQYPCLENLMDRGALAGCSPWGRRVGHD